MVWETTPTGITREQAIAEIKRMATAQGYSSTFKVTYDGTIIETPDQLPVSVDMSKVRISSMLNNA